MRDPLGNIELVELVFFDAVLEESVDQLANFCHRTFLSQVLKFVEWLLPFN